MNRQLLILPLTLLIFFAPISARAQTSPAWHPAVAPLMTRWAKDVSPVAPLPEYPRPQMTRLRWQSLNGLWDYALTDSAATAPPPAMDGRILVPFPFESALSGIGKASPTTQRLWYRRRFTVSALWRTGGQRVLLHFGAVNWDSTVAVNGVDFGDHKGGFDAFDDDITDALKPGVNVLTVSAWNPLTIDSPDAQVVGKQRSRPGGIFYTGSTGIWQTVWLEPVPAARIVGLKITPNIDDGAVHVTVDTEGAPGASVQITAIDRNRAIRTETGPAGSDIALPIPQPHFWSPDDPYLYGLHAVIVGKGDAVDSYFAMRKVTLGKDDRGRTSLFLNNQPLLEIGALDQGYWPDGIYTAPTDDALKSDIVAAKGFAFNLLRKHAKVEPDRWYYWTDRLGMLVWQDMPQCFGPPRPGPDGGLTETARAQWLTEWKREIATHYNHPSIVVWTTFNEGWGQHDTESVVALTKQLDPTRLVDDASGWNDRGVGDIRDTHAYPGPWSEKPEAGRAVVNGEFGGLTMRVPGHMWTDTVVGYGATLTGGWKVTQKYQALMKTAYALHGDNATSAFVYTQLTDVEGESNGLLTYDRAVVKPLAEFIAAANKGDFPALPPAPVSHDLVPTSEDAPHVWSYVTTKPADDWAFVGFDAAGWMSAPAPFGQGYDGINTPWTDTPGDIWLRRTVTLPAVIPPKLVVLARHDEDVQVYVNGVPAAWATGYNAAYVALPMTEAGRAALKPGAANVIAVHCRQTVGGQIIDVGIAAAP